MSDDILARAEALREDLEDGDDDYADEREIIAELIAEIKRQAAYVARLEAAFLEADERAIYWEYQYTGTPITDERRKEKSERLLEKIRGEQE